MATEILTKIGAPIVWADTTDYSSTGSGYTRTDQLALATLATGAAREGTKGDVGATRAAKFAVHVGFELDVAPTAGNVIEVYWSSSASATAGTGNAGGAAGADGAYKAGEEAEWVKQLTFLGALVCTADAATVVQRQCINDAFVPPQRYGMPVVYNRSGQALEGDDVEMYVALVPIIDELQNA